MKYKWLNLVDLIFVLVLLVFWFKWFSNGTLMSYVISASIGYLFGSKLAEIILE